MVGHDDIAKRRTLLGGELTQADGIIDLSGPEIEGLKLGRILESGGKWIDQIVEREFIDFRLRTRSKRLSDETFTSCRR